MGGRRWTPEEDAVIRECALSLTSHEIASLLPGRTKMSVDSRRNKLGLHGLTGGAEGARRTEAWIGALENRIGEPIEDWLKRRYEVEQATYREIIAELGINTRTLIKLMRRCGVVPVSASEAASRQIVRNPQKLVALIEASRKEERFLHAAQNRQLNWERHITSSERQLLTALNDIGLFPVSQFAAGRYSIDLAFPGIQFAVEIDPGWHMSKRKRAADVRRDMWLREQGWTVLRLPNTLRLESKVRRVSDALIKLASTQPR